MTELKPCAHYGGKAELINRDDYRGNDTYWVECGSCDIIMGKEDSSPHYDVKCSSGCYGSKEEAIEMWNRRV